MNYEWVVINVGISEAEEHLNKLDTAKYEIFSVHPFAQDGINALTILARRPKKPTGDVRY